jgi:hypothetical protein
MRAAGDRIWFTTDGQMCTDTPFCAVERLLPHYCFRCGAEAYEFWGAAWLTYDPYRFGRHAYIHQSSAPGKSFWVRYPNGDGFLIYPGEPIGHDGLVSSVRLEQAREGVEDYEYLCLHKSMMAKAQEAGRDITRARATAERARNLVSIPNAGGRHSTKILPVPDSVLELREELARSIEELFDGQRTARRGTATDTGMVRGEKVMTASEIQRLIETVLQPGYGIDDAVASFGAIAEDSVPCTIRLTPRGENVAEALLEYLEREEAPEGSRFLSGITIRFVRPVVMRFALFEEKHGTPSEGPRLHPNQPIPYRFPLDGYAYAGDLLLYAHPTDVPREKRVEMVKVLRHPEGE